MDALYLVKYTDDVSFDEKLDKANELLRKYKIGRADGAKELFSDLGIHCASKDLTIEARSVSCIFKIPFSIFSKEDKTYRE